MTGSKLIDKIDPLLPLEIIDIQILGDQLIIEGSLWAIVLATSWWRVILNGKFLFGCTEDKSAQ